jgi:hypothetical protein
MIAPPPIAGLVHALPRRWVAVGIALFAPWIWLTLLDAALRRKR